MYGVCTSKRGKAQGSAETKRLGDQETRRLGDQETRRLGGQHSALTETPELTKELRNQGTKGNPLKGT